MANVFSADTSAINAAARLHAEIGDTVARLTGEFSALVRESAGWAGRDDRMWSELYPRDVKDRADVEGACEALARGVANSAKLLNINAIVIQGAQNDALELIGDHASKTGSGRH
ncbi:hypothetical protein AB0C52_28160 [Streptomyces sp. NPDC048717]|uniref:hypothetical protein n=1 Tax=Streptomyces sp. NPDC048717 TaxID=3154928 RepID=UPI003427F967